LLLTVFVFKGEFFPLDGSLSPLTTFSVFIALILSNIPSSDTEDLDTGGADT